MLCCAVDHAVVGQDVPGVLERSNLKVVDSARYMDDVRVWLRALRLGWRWIDGELRYKRSWRLEEEQGGLTLLAINPSPSLSTP